MFAGLAAVGRRRCLNVDKMLKLSTNNMRAFWFPGNTDACSESRILKSVQNKQRLHDFTFLVQFSLTLSKRSCLKIYLPKAAARQ